MLLFSFYEGILLYNDTMIVIIDLTFKAKRKRNFYDQTTYIVKVSFFRCICSLNKENIIFKYSIINIANT